jgi:hypothetical protein
VVSKPPLELSYCFTVREVASIDRLADAVKDALLDGAVCRF